MHPQTQGNASPNASSGASSGTSSKRASLRPGEAELVFQHAVEGLFHVGLKGQVTPPLQARLKDAGLDLSRPLLPAYPRAAWNRFIQVTAETLWPDETPEQAYHQLGRQLLLGYSRTLMGGAIIRLLRLIGPRRTLDRMTQNFRSGGNYNLCKVTELGPREVLLWMNEPTLHPSYVAGIVDMVLELVGVAERSITVHARDEEGCTYRVRWEA
ncbi:DUF2378 family protein [Aggregicoccus sp. 17bor-14]|uniref:DUF2378 family protein n=1 Tax=Myxococcaceae TaxID=31 RepID=UPI00129CE5BA|nr:MULTISPECIES: DUF2378 family protein [Myxococcaceae]MBF5043222.1 DUF2378 family protein [Simulacricoccus sp. 17bor-14]MRI88979.1 DUF2378 family protein [Aggregicoccus sp. 17bor-14]